MKAFKKILKYIVVYGLLLAGPAALTAIVLVVIDRLNGGSMDSDSVWESPYMQPAMLLGQVLIIAVFLWRRWAVLGLGRIKRSDVWMVVLMSVIVFIGWYYPEDYLDSLLRIPDNLTADDYENMTGGVIGLIDTGILTPISEELLFRGAILGTLLPLTPRRPWVAIAISAILFGIAHLNPVQIVFGALYGLLFGWLYWRTASLLPGIVVHVVNNTIVVFFWPASFDKAINSMSTTTEIMVLVVSLVALIAALRWFALKYTPDNDQSQKYPT